MDHPWRHPSGHISGATPSLHPDATRSTDEAHQTHFELAAVGSGSALYSNTGPIGHQEHPRNHTWDYYSVREQNTDRRCLPLSSSVATELAEPQVGSRKRKSPAVDNSMQNKKARVGEGTGGHSQFSGSQRLPAGVWRLIFTFLPPKMLGRLLSVSKGFNSFLCPSSKYSRDAPSSSTTDPLSIMRPEMIWQLSRRRFWPTMPTPFRDHTELEMWQLACQSGCHFRDRKCQRTPSPLYGSLNLEDKHSSAQLIWPFSLRSCVPCLIEMTTKEVDLMLSPSTPLCLLTALPFILIGDDMRIIPSTMLQTVQAAMKLSVTKYFLSSHVEAIREEFTAIKAMGKATAEEWLKGLEGRGKVYRTDSQRWEKFEISGGLVRMQQRLSSDYTVDHGKMYASTKPSKDSVAASTVKSLSSGNPSPLQSATVTSKSCLVYSQGENSSARSILEHKIHLQANISRSKTREEAEDLKAVRRAEIERRAANLEPPLPAHILALTPTFQAAIQITLPLDDTAWNLLKPRLIAQRKDVDQQLKPKQETPPHFQTAFQQSLDLQSTRISTLKSKQHVDKTWDDVQVPLRERISILADRIISDGWGGGRKVNRESSPRFAVDVLMYVRKQFYVEIQDSDTTTRAAGQSPLRDAVNRPYTKKLTLENMKWLFDVKIKPHTDPFRKELFYCRDCETKPKLYGFEGVVQHYAAKHTGSMSLGSIVVHWRAEWPEVPPFHPKPHTLKDQRTGYPKNKPNEVLGSTLGNFQAKPHGQEPTAPSYRQSLPYVRYDVAPTQPSFGQSHLYTTPLGEYTHPSQDQGPQRSIHVHSNENTYQDPFGAIRNAGSYESVQAIDMGACQSHGNTPYRNHFAHGFCAPYQIQLPNIHQTKLEYIARNSRELWFSIAPIRELPEPIRVFVVIHHVSNRFRTRFLEEPPLSLFIDGLSNNKKMRPIRNVNNLQCKVCCLGLGMAEVAAQDKGSYSLPQLIKHFRRRHFELPCTAGAPALDWHTDMIYLPDLNFLSNLKNPTHVDDRKLAIVHQALASITPNNSWRWNRDATIPTVHDRALRDHKSASDSYVSNQQGLKDQLNIQYTSTLRHTNQWDYRMRSVDKDMLEEALRTSLPTEPGGLGNISIASISRAGLQHTHQAVIDAVATHNAKASTTASPVQPISPPMGLSPNQSRESLKVVEHDDDDNFDLIAGLESQLDKQASFVCLNTTLGSIQ